MGTDALLAVGEVVGVHGVRGTLKIRSYAESETLFETGASVVLKDAQGREMPFRIGWAKPQKRRLLLSLVEIEGREQAEALIGSRVLIEKSRLPTLAQGEYYWFELIGLAVFASDGSYIGRLEGILPTGSNDVYLVRDGARETLIPAVENVVKEIDRAAGRMRVDLPEEL